MSNELVLNVICTLVSILGLWYLLFWLVRDYFIDKYRQRMFQLRDQLFDHAADGMIAFDQDAYLILRNTMNGIIRFGHQITLIDFVFNNLVRKSDDQVASKYREAWTSSLENLSQNVTDELLIVKSEMEVIVIKQLILSSPIIFFFVLIPLAILLLLDGVFRGLMVKILNLIQKSSRNLLDELDSVASAKV